MDKWQRMQFWDGFIKHMKAAFPKYIQWNPSEGKRQIVPRMWFGNGVRIAAGINWDEENTIQVDLTLNSPRNELLTTEWYRILITDKSNIRGQLISAPDDLWKPDVRDGKPESWIVVKKLALPEEQYWPAHYSWLAEKVHQFHHVLGPMIERLPSHL